MLLVAQIEYEPPLHYLGDRILLTVCRPWGGRLPDTYLLKRGLHFRNTTFPLTWWSRKNCMNAAAEA